MGVGAGGSGAQRTMAAEGTVGPWPGDWAEGNLRPGIGLTG